MFDLQPILTFSHAHCIAICAVLVPWNLLATLQTLILVGLDRSRQHCLLAALLALVPALLMMLHVVSWLVVGVVMAPTFILLGLGFTCFWINGWAIAAPTSLTVCLKWLVVRGRQVYLALLQANSQASNLKS